MPNKWKVNTSKVRGRLREKGLTIEDLALAIGCARQTLNAKLNGKRPFTIQEAATTADLLSDTPLIFFALEDANLANKDQIN